jgi:phosphotransferase system  glucose/maltose/N-acetylglucosamine-specific IIC component|tara:strand:+ start:147 stop:365 length:219 start_codon:yes stop_codon:yes gene_type:complete
MMDTVKSFLRSIMDVALVVIPLSVVLGLIFGPSVPFIGTAVVGNITDLVSSLGGNGLVGIIVLGVLWTLARR